jgi:hypothetical protein
MASRAPTRSAAAASPRPTRRTSSRSNLADRARPENLLRSGSTETPARRTQNRRGPLEGGGGAVLLLARVRSRIETASPLPRIFIMGIAGADRDRAGVDIAVIDVPAFLGGVSRSATGEIGHGPLKRGLSGRALISGPVVFRGTPPQTPKVSLAVAAEAGFCRIRGRERRS